MHLSEIRAQIGKLPLLHELPEALRLPTAMLFLGVGHEMTATGGQVLLREGDPDDDTAFLLLEGAVSVTKEENPENTTEAPDLLGELVKFNPIHKRAATLRAMSDLKLLKFTWTAFFSAAESIFSEEQQTTLRDALADVAWQHFTS